MKKKWYYKPGLSWERRKKFLLVFLLNVFLFFGVQAQTHRVTLNVKETSLEQVIKELEKQTGLQFFYSQDKIEKITGLSLQAKQEDFKTILDRLLKHTPLTFTVMDNVVVIKDREKTVSPLQSAIREIKGVVTDVLGNTLPGVTVRIKGTTLGGITDTEGAFQLSLPEGEAVLQFSFVGMKPLEVVLGNQEFLRVKLEEEKVEMDEVVVTGYFERKKDSYTGSATTFSGEQLKQVSTGNILNTLSMVDPSFKLMENLDAGSNPNYVPEFTIHGGGNLQSEYENSPNMPTFILDGFEVSSEKIFDLDPNRVASITILKDAAATAIYGSRAANGVVVVETKAPVMGKMRVSYNFSGDFEIADLSDYNLMNAAEKVEYERLAGLYSHPNIQIGDDYMDGYNERLALVKRGIDTDWITKPVKDVGFSHKHSLFLEGGDTKLRYGLTVNYQNKNGVMRGSGRDNLGVGVQLQYRYKTLKFMNDLTYSHMKMTDSPYGDFSEYTWLNPYYYPYDENGNVKQVLYTFADESQALNPMYNATLGTKSEKAYDDFINNFSLEWDIVEGLKLKSKISLNKKNMTSDNFKPSEHTDFYKEEVYKGSYTKTVSDYFSYDASVTLAFTKRLDKHQLNAVAVWNVKQSKTDRFETTAYNFPNSNMDHIGMGIQYGDGDQPTGDYEITRLMGVVANFNYGFDDRYLLDFSVRSDGSSMFGADKRWGTFGSVGVGWNIHNEAWFKGNILISQLKIRGSWGLVGNNRIGAYQYMQTVSVKNGISFGDKLAQTAEFASTNPDLKWETTRMANIGFELGLLNNDLNITFDCFNNRTKDILVNLPVPGLFGNGAPIQNAGKVETRGWELSVSYRLKTGPVVHNFAGNISDSFNEVIDTRGTEIIGGSDVQTIIKEGYPLYSYYAYRSDGFFQNEEECQKGPHLEGITPKPGDIRYLDKNGDGVIKPDDDRFIVGNDFPRYTFGFTYGLEYKGFDFSMMWQGVGKRNKWMRGESVEAFHNNNEGPVMDFHQDRWTPNNPDATYPRLTMGAESANNAAKSDFWIQDAKYLRLKNAQIGYTFSQQWMKKLYVKNLRIFASVQNPLTFTKMKGGWDPEYTGDGSGRSYPVARVYSFGLNVKF